MMNRFKRCISFVLVVGMLVTLGGYLASARESDPVAAALADEIKVLSALKILKDGETDMTAKVSRTAFSDAVAMMVQEQLESYEPIYDLGGSDSGMQWLYQADMLHGNGAGEFRPQDVITVTEAAKIALCITGYDQLAEEEGGYPTGYLKIGSRIGVLDGVQGAADAELTYQDFVTLLYNLIHIEIMEPVSYRTDGLVRYQMGGVHTLLATYRNINKGDGIVNANEVSGLYQEADATQPGMLRVDEMLFHAAAVHDAYSDMLGHQVEYWYRNHENTNKELICMISVVERHLVIPAADILSYENGIYRYENESGTIMQAAISNETTILYNGAPVVNNTVFQPRQGSVELIDNNRDGSYDVLKIRDRQLVLVQGTYEADGVFSVYDLFNLSYNLSIRTAEPVRYRVYNAEGRALELSNIAAGNVLEVEKTASSDPYYRITVVTESTVATLQSQLQGSYMTDLGEYETTARFEELAKTDIDVALGNTYRIYFTSDGRIAYISEDVQGGELLTYRIGYLARAAEKQYTFSSSWLLRILDESGSWEDFTLAERVLVDDTELEREDITGLSAHEGELVKYLLNIQGEIVELHFPAPIPGNSATTAMDEEFQVIFKNDSARYRYYPSGYVFGTSLNADNIVQVPGKCKLFVKPKEMTAENSSGGYLKEDYIGVSTASSALVDGTNYQVTAYSTSATPGLVDVALVSMNDPKGLLKEMDRAVVINEVATAIDEQGEDCYLVTALYNGQPATYEIYDQRTSGGNLPFGAGDVVFLYTNTEGKYVIYDDIVSGGNRYGCGWKMLCDYTATGLDPYLDRNRFHGSQPVIKVTDGGNRVKYGTVYDVQGTNILINTTDHVNDWQTVEALNNSRGYVYVWDEREKTFRTGTNYDAVCAKYDPANASKAYVVDDNQFLIIVLYPSESV